jgi:hypothetical protein
MQNQVYSPGAEYSLSSTRTPSPSIHQEWVGKGAKDTDEVLTRLTERLDTFKKLVRSRRWELKGRRAKLGELTRNTVRVFHVIAPRDLSCGCQSLCPSTDTEKMNTAPFNASRNADGSRPSKRRRTGVYHDRLPLNDDLDVINSRATQFNISRRLISETPRTAQMGEMMWVADDNEFGLDPGSEWYEEAMEGDVMEDRGPPEVKKKKKARSRLSVSSPSTSLQIALLMSIQKRPHLVWKERHRTEYLDEFIRWEGQGDFRRERVCPDCVARGVASPGTPDHRCSDCCLPDLVCASCCVRRHRCLPLHRIEVRPVHSAVLSINLLGGRSGVVITLSRQA